MPNFTIVEKSPIKEPFRLSPGIKETLVETAAKLRGSDLRTFMAKIVNSMGKGGQRKAESELGWDRKLIRKGQRELTNGPIKDNFSARGRKKAEEHMPELLKDIESIIEPQSQTDPTFRTEQLYTPLSAGRVISILIEEYNYCDYQIPCESTIRNKINDLGCRPQKVAKSSLKKNC